MSTIRQRLDDPLNAFCQDTEAYLVGAANGPLTGLTFAAKDIFDIVGYVTGGGNPDWRATHAAATHGLGCTSAGGRWGNHGWQNHHR